VFHVALGHLDQVRDEVVTTLQLDLDLRERVLEAVAKRDQLVEDADHQHADDEHQNDNDGKRDEP
jgi:hypothetical protein